MEKAKHAQVWDWDNVLKHYIYSLYTNFIKNGFALTMHTTLLENCMIRKSYRTRVAYLLLIMFTFFMFPNWSSKIYAQTRVYLCFLYVVKWSILSLCSWVQLLQNHKKFNFCCRSKLGSVTNWKAYPVAYSLTGRHFNAALILITWNPLLPGVLLLAWFLFFLVTVIHTVTR